MKVLGATLVAFTLAAGTLVASTAGGGNICKGKAFPWFGECWSFSEGPKFQRELESHGASAKTFKQRHPKLAAVFRQPWPILGPDWAAMERSFPRALRHAASRFGVSYSWLWACAGSEGGRTPGHVAHGDAGEVGWFQFLPSTWNRMSPQAFSVRGAPPRAYRHIRSVVGQTWTASYAFMRGWSGEWFGDGC